MVNNNPLRKFAETANRYPSWLSSRLMTWVFRNKVKLTGTVGIDILHTDFSAVTFRQKNRRKVQNHIGGVHAAGMALLAESATGFIVGVNLPGDKLPLLKSMHVDYLKRSQGDMQATAWLDEAQLRCLSEQDKGEITVAVKVTDESGEEPIACQMVWAWVPKKR